MDEKKSEEPRKKGNGSVLDVDAVVAFGQAPSVLSRADVAYITGTPLSGCNVTREKTWYDDEG